MAEVCADPWFNNPEVATIERIKVEFKLRRAALDATNEGLKN